MTNLMQPRGIRNCTNAVEVFEESLLDIRDGLWVCGQLSQNNTECRHVHKPQGCALGLVGINTGNCTWDLRRDSATDFIIVEHWEHEDVDQWSELAQECIVILGNAAVEVSDRIREKYENDYGHFNNDGELIGQPPEMHDATTASDYVIDYNDNGLSTQKADAWFSLALDMAKKKNRGDV